MNEDVPWHYVALIVIAFLSWLFNRIQEATAERRRAKELERRRAEARQPSTGGSATAPSRGSSAPPPLPKQVPPGEESEEDLLSELFEALGGKPQAPPPRPQRPVRVERPPAPVERPKVSATDPDTRLSAAERAALDRVKAGKAPVLAAPESASRARRKHRKGGTSDYARLLRSPNRLRQAMVLKEILDAPLALRPESDQGGRGDFPS